MSELALEVGGLVYEGWTGGSVTRSLETISGTFGIRLSEKSPGTASPRAVKPGDACAAFLDGDRVIAGFIDSVRVTYDTESHEIEIAGRDATGDLVDCSAASEPGEWHDETLERIVAALCRPFGVSVRSDASAGDAAGTPFRRFRIEEGETVFEAIDRGCRMRGVLPLSDGAGGIVLGRPSRTRAGVRLEHRVNILRASGDASWLQRHSAYTLLGQQPGSDWITPGDAAHVFATAEDAGVTRYRPLTVIAEQALDAAEAAERIEWEAVVRAARSRRATVAVRGWRETPEADSPLWSPGRLVRIVDPWLGLDREMLVSRTVQGIGEEGTVTELELYPETAFLARIEPEEADDASGWWPSAAGAAAP